MAIADQERESSRENKMKTKRIRVVFTSLIFVCFMAGSVLGQAIDIPKVHANITADSSGRLVFIGSDSSQLPLIVGEDGYTLRQMRLSSHGTENGVAFDFNDSDLNGKLYFGLIESPNDLKHPQPVFHYHSAKIDSGQAEIDINKRLRGRYDFIDWQKTGIIRLGYRVTDQEGQFLYDGKIMVKGKGPFVVDTSIVEGPFINLVTYQDAVVSFETNYPTRAQVQVAGRSFMDDKPVTHHEIRLDGLDANTEYQYTVVYGNYRDSYCFQTAPVPGSRRPFTFAYASDGRGGSGGGERNIRGVNSYIMKRIAVLASFRGVRFFQFTGDLVDGYSISEDDIMLQYANWKRTIEPYAHYIPFIAGFGNHENLLLYFSDGKTGVGIDRFPFATHSGEVVFARNFVNPTNGPQSEDGAVYDPDPGSIDFPPYDETVFYYTYDNVAMIVLNSNYWYSYSIKRTPEIGGNLHGYIMDNQLAWLKSTLAELETDDNIDHIFVTVHTPIFPNGGHVDDDMWYGGDNTPRPTIAGEPVAKGIIERRDQLLDLLMNHSSKVVATLTGDEHNYYRLRVTDEMQIYPEDYEGERLSRFRPFWHINNGAAGAPYYGRENTPWSAQVEKFSTQNAVVFFHVHGKEIRVEVINPDTMEPIDEFQL